ncbi:hypothetical protein FOZ63_023689, partial [Perkinsus olseni]
MILCAEIGDKTFFIATVLSMKHNHVVVFLGAIGALALMTVLSAALGFVLPTLLSKHFTHYTCITLFLYFGLKLLKEAYEMDAEGGENVELKEVELELKFMLREEDDDCSPPSPASEGVPDDCEEGPSRRRGWACSEETLFSRLAIRVFTQAFTMTFLAEWGDRSQISTIALASSKNPLGVTVGGVLGHCICTGVAVIGGKLLAKRISERHICLAGGVLFLAFAITSIVMGVEDESASINGGFSVDGPVHVRNEESVACTGVVDYDYDATECWGKNDMCDRGHGDGEDEVEEVDFFKEKGKSLTLIEEIVALAVEQRELQGTRKEFDSVLGRCQRLCYDLKDLLQPYQERGALLDAHMADLTSPLIAFIVDQVSRKEPRAWPKSCHLICSTLYLMFKVRGLSRAPFGHFPHEISLIEPVLDQAEVLLLTESGNEGSEALEGWESNCTTALKGHCERLHRAAALCLARLIAREDILENSVKNDFFAQLS